jgi:hypothetical protein
MRYWLRLAAALAAPLAMGACAKVRSVKMLDPRTGVAVTCASDRYNVFTTNTIREEVGSCVGELGYYGFRDAQSVEEAHSTAPVIPRPQPRAQPLTRVPPGTPGAATYPPYPGARPWYDGGS